MNIMSPVLYIYTSIHPEEASWYQISSHRMTFKFRSDKIAKKCYALITKKCALNNMPSSVIFIYMAIGVVCGLEEQTQNNVQNIINVGIPMERKENI